MGRKLWHDQEMFFGPCLQLYKIFLIHYHMLERKRQWPEGLEDWFLSLTLLLPI